MNIILWVENKILAEGIKNILQKTGSFNIAVSGTSKDIILPTGEKPHLMVVASKSGTGGIVNTIKTFRQKYSDLNVLLFVEEKINHDIMHLHKSGITGFIPGDCDSEDLLYAVQKTAKGNFYLHHSIAYNLLQEFDSQAPHLNKIEPGTLNISQRELEVLELLTDGFTSNEIAEKLFTSRRTVESHRRNLMDKTKSKNTAELIKFSICNQLIHPAPGVNGAVKPTAEAMKS